MPRFSHLVFFLPALCLAGSLNAPVSVENGQLSGVAGSSSGVMVFKGVPYAAPPVGDLRWRAPKAPAHWDGVRKADQFGSTCMQAPYPEGSIYRSTPEPVSEDCLYLNIWTAAKSSGEHRPVMVWIHGGALTRGAGSTSLYDGEEFAKKGVVLVTINYRLGVFGFFAHPELTKESDRNSSGNYGILDQISALEWVQKNIAAFGGDSKRVTIFGESAGSWSVNCLMATPLAHGLFQRVIGESGAEFGPMRKLADAEQAGAKLGTSMGADSLAALRAKSAEELLKASNVGAPNVDGWLFPTDIYSIFASGKQNDVPMLIGSNADEGTAFTPPGITAKAFEQTARTRFGAQADQYLKIYPESTDMEARKSAAEAMRDQTFGWEMRTWARMEKKTGKSRVYLYYFSRVPPGPGSERYGAYHASEIAYVFNNLSRANRPWEETDHKLADAMSSYWVNFAAAGDPNGKGLTKWPAYTEKGDMLLGLGNQIAAESVPHKPALDFLDTYNANLRSSAK